MEALLVLPEETFVLSLSSIKEVKELKDISLNTAELFESASRNKININFSEISVQRIDEFTNSFVLPVTNGLFVHFYFPEGDTNRFKPMIDLSKSMNNNLDEDIVHCLVFEENSFENIRTIMQLISEIQSIENIEDNKMPLTPIMKDKVRYNGDTTGNQSETTQETTLQDAT